MVLVPSSGVLRAAPLMRRQVAAVVIGEVGLDQASIDVSTRQPQDAIHDPVEQPGRDLQLGRSAQWL